MKTGSPEVTTKLLNEHAEDVGELSRLTLLRLYQRGEKANGPDESFAVVLGADTRIVNDVKSFGGAAVPLEVVSGTSVSPATVVYGATLNQIQKLCTRHKVSVGALLEKNAHQLVVFYDNKQSSFEFPKGVDGEFVFDPQVLHEAFGKALGQPVLFQYVPSSYFDALALRPYEEARKRRNAGLGGTGKLGEQHEGKDR